MFLAKICKKIIPISIKKRIKNTISFISSKEYRFKREHKKCFGSLNPDKTFFVIRKDVFNWGLYTTWLFVLEQIKYAIENDYIPIVDLKNYYMFMMQSSEKKNKENSWEYYYEQPISNYNLDEVYKSKNVILSSLYGISNTVDWNDVLPKEVIQEWNKWAINYLRLNKKLEKGVEEEYKRLFPKGKRILGVSIRRGYERGEKLGIEAFNGHPLQAGLKEYIEDIEFYLKEWKCDYFFLSTEDRETCDIFKEKWGEQCILMERKRMHCFENNIPLPAETSEQRKKIVCEFETDKNGYVLYPEEKNISYLKEVYLLERCDCLLASISSGVVAALINNGNKYDHIKMYQKGKMHIVNKKE